MNKFLQKICTSIVCLGLSASILNGFSSKKLSAETITPWSKVDGVIYNSRLDPIPGANFKGIDVSQWQGTIAWNQVKYNSDVDFVIIRCGFGGDTYQYDDTQWRRNADECTRLGIPFGVYLYSYAKTPNEALDEANHVLRLIKGYNLTYPVYYDLEEKNVRNSVSKSKIAEMADVFCRTIENAGYRAGVYSSLDWFTNYLTDPVFDRYDKWLAQWYYMPTYNKPFRLWQSASTGHVPGIQNDVDINIDYSTVLLKNGWIQEGGFWRYYVNGVTKKGWQLIDNKWYYFDQNGWMKTGWLSDQNKWYLLSTSGAMITGWKQINNNWYFFNSSGAMSIGWVHASDHSYYFSSSGVMTIGWKQIGDKWYFFDENGILQKSKWIGDFYFESTGEWNPNKVPAKWIQGANGWWYRHGDGSYTTNAFENIDGKTYYFNQSGYRVTGWRLINQNWYYFDSDGTKKTGWLLLSNTWYFLDNDGKMLTGFQMIGKDQFYFTASGAMLTGWQLINNKWYYFASGGQLQKDTWIGNYYVDINGVWDPNLKLSRWIQDVNGWWFSNADGTYPYSTFKTIGINTYYFDSRGYMVTGWQFINEHWYFFNSNGTLARSTWINNFYFDEQGIWQP